MNGNPDTQPHPGSVPNPAAVGGPTVGQVAKEASIRAGIQGLVALLVGGSLVYFNAKLSS